MTGDRELDVVVFGATGFTGRLVAQRLVEEHHGLTIGIAGRDAARLDEVRGHLERHADHHHTDVATTAIVADAHDQRSLAALARRSRAVVTTVGPFADHGFGLASACVEAGTHYADISGEPAFVARLVEELDGPAHDAGVRLVSCCGFDSVPPDLGAWLAAEALPDDADVQVRAYVSADARFSGGTFASAIGAVSGDATAGIPRPDPGPGRRVGSLRPRIHRQDAVAGWGVPLPTIDPQIVLRSAATLPEYGRSFRYGHYARVTRLPVAVVGVAGVAAGAAMARFAPTRRLLERAMPEPGEGPPPEVRARSSFRVTLLGAADDARVRIEVRGGDPGYDETSRMLAQAGRALVEDDLPVAAGALTPAVGLGRAYLDRLTARGLTFEVTSAAA